MKFIICIFSVLIHKLCSDVLFFAPLIMGHLGPFLDDQMLSVSLVFSKKQLLLDFFPLDICFLLIYDLYYFLYLIVFIL